MAKQCSDCIYFDSSNSYCRRNSPTPGLTGSKAVVWPQVATTDWCAEGWNPIDGYYDPRGFSNANP